MPEFVAFFERLSTFCRVLLFDKAGVGLSDPVPKVRTLDDRAAEIEAVMDAAGFERAVLFGPSEGGSASIFFAATRPERTRALILNATSAYSFADGWDDLDRDPAELRARLVRELGEVYTQAYVESLLGVPRFIANPDAPLEERIYRLPGAWVAIQFKGAAVYLLSITITDSTMWYRTGGSIGVIDVKLGQDTFAQASDLFDGQQVWVGNKQAGYYRHYHFGGAGGGHQHFWLSFNAVGAGKLDGIAGPYSSGIYGDYRRESTVTKAAVHRTRRKSHPTH